MTPKPSATTRPRRVDEIGDESRRRILDAAEELFVERGYARTAIVDIAERSGISRGSIPWHFKNKEGLLVAVVKRALDRYLDPASDTPETYNLDEKLERVKAWMRHPTATMFYTVLGEALTEEGPLRSNLIEFQRREIAHLADIIGQPPSTLSRPECEELATLFNGAFLGLHLQWTLDPSTDLDARIDALGLVIRQTVGATRRTGVPTT